jgi:hypothetical protein
MVDRQAEAAAAAKQQQQSSSSKAAAAKQQHSLSPTSLRTCFTMQIIFCFSKRKQNVLMTPLFALGNSRALGLCVDPYNLPAQQSSCYSNAFTTRSHRFPRHNQSIPPHFDSHSGRIMFSRPHTSFVNAPSEHPIATSPLSISARALLQASWHSPAASPALLLLPSQQIISHIGTGQSMGSGQLALEDFECH